jgi:hypothetical protein
MFSKNRFGFGHRAFDGYPATRGFDAVGAGSFAFMQAQLELIDTKIVEPLHAVTHPRDIKMKIGGGFPEFISMFATNYKTPGVNALGIQGNSNTEVPIVQADIQKAVATVHTWAHALSVTYLDLQRLATAKASGMPPPISLQQMYEEGLTVIWNKALDYNCYLGFNGLPGLINNPSVPEIVVPNGASNYPQWSKKTPNEWLNDVNLMCNTIMANSGYDAAAAMPNHLLLPYTQYALLSTPMTIGGVGWENARTYIETNCIAAADNTFKIDKLPNSWISGQGAGSPATDRAVCYRNDEDCLYMGIPTQMYPGMTAPSLRNGGSYETIYYGAMSQVVFRRTTTQIYADAI